MPLDLTNSSISSANWANPLLGFNEKPQDTLVGKVSAAADPVQELHKALSQAVAETEKSAAIKSTLSNAINWVWSTLWGQPSGKTDTTKPMIPAPDYIDETKRQSFIEDMLETQKRIEEISEDYQQMVKEDPQRAESLLMKLMLLIIKANLKAKEDQGLVKGKKIELYQDTKLDLEKTHAKISRELAAIDSRRQTVHKVHAVVSLVVGAAVVITFAATTAGAALPTTFTVMANTGLGTAKAGTILFQGFLDGKLEEKQKESFLVNAKQELAQEGINVGLDEIRRVMQDMNSLWSLLKDIANRQRESLRMIRQ